MLRVATQTTTSPMAKPTLLRLHTPMETHKPNPPIRTHFPLHRPEYRPVRIKPLPNNPKPKPKPVATTTTSDVLRLMDSLKLPVTTDIYASLVKECSDSGDPSKAIELHRHVFRSGARPSLPLLNRILLMHVSCGCHGHARKLFDEMFLRDFHSWAIVIGSCVENGDHGEAISLFIKMLREKGFGRAGDEQMGLSVSGILVCVLKACLCTMEFELGAQVHGWLWKMGYSKSVALSSFLIGYYGKVGCFEGAERVFEQARFQNTAVWTSRIVNYCSGDDDDDYDDDGVDDNFDEAIRVFNEMGWEGVRKNGYTFSAVLKACKKMGDVGCGRQVHASVMKLGLDSDGYVQSALVDLYGKCGFIKDAAMVFEKGRSKNNRACYNAMVANYVRHGFHMEAIKVIHRMRRYGFIPCESVLAEVGLGKNPENYMEDEIH